MNRLRTLSRRQRFLIFMLGLLLVVGGAGYTWLFADLPSLDQLEAGLALPSTRIYDRNGKLLYEILPPEQGRNTVIALETIPDHCVNAVIATEDAGFYNHPGVDIGGVIRALWINLQGGEIVAGGSTITQQLVRTVLLDPDQRAQRTLERKLKEMILALRLQSVYSKDDTLELYMNQVYFGNLAYGIEGAARAYFNKPATDLSLAECALLGGIIQNAVLHDPLTNYESAKARQEVTLGLMVQNGYITQTQADIAKSDDLQFAASRFPIDAPHFVMAVWKQLERDYPDYLYQSALDVVTTVDLDWQNAAQDIVQTQLDALNHPPFDERVPANANNAAIVALDPYTGEVLTMLGSPDYFDESIDGAVNAALALRQPGSALKPFTYAAGMNPEREHPLTAATMFLDVRTPFVTQRLESYVPANYGFVEHGPVLAREALASSYNIPAVLALQDAGIEAMIELSANAGLETLINNTDLDLAVTLGGGEVRLIDLAQAYAIFPNGGYRVEPTYIHSVKIRDAEGFGQTLYEWTPDRLTNQVLDERVAYIITDILSDSDARIPSFGKPSALDIGRPAAAKTGTTTDFRDNWVVGYTPDLVVGVWVGNANNTPMVNISGISGAGPIWNSFMRKITLGTPEREFARPDGLTTVKVCSLSGLLPTPLCPLTREELFIEGTTPTEVDNLYQELELDAATGLLADANTPPERRQRRVFVVLPQEAREWARANGLPIPPDTVATAPDANVGLRLLSPDPYTVYQLSPSQPAENQRLKFSAGTAPQTRSVTFTLNGQDIATDREAPFEIFWSLALGEFELTASAVLADGTIQTASVIPFSVVEYEEPVSRNAAQNAAQNSP